MAKKTTRRRKELAQQRAIQQAVANTATAAASQSSASRAPAAAAATGQPAADYTAEYARVRTDLKHIAIIAASIIAVLIALSFVVG